MSTIDYGSQDEVQNYLLFMTVAIIKASQKDTVEEQANIVNVCVSQLMRTRATHEMEHVMKDGPVCPFCAARILAEALKPRLA